VRAPRFGERPGVSGASIVADQDRENGATDRSGMASDCRFSSQRKPALRARFAGHKILDELITNRYTLDNVNQGYEDMLAGRNIRGILIHEH
jgi:alcohol dehydrogenase (nicotinoprotein)